MKVRFDVMYNNIASDAAPGLNDYEVSLFLTMAEKEIMKNYFNPKGNKYQEGYDGSPKRQIDFSNVTKVLTVTSTGEGGGEGGDETTSTPVFQAPVFDNRSTSRSTVFPSDVWFPIHERVVVLREGKAVNLKVVPITYGEYDRLMSKPFKYPLKYQAWRLLNTSDERSADIVVGPNDSISEYTIRYVRKPLPIIVGSIEGYTIDGYPTEETTAPIPCELDPMLHEEILQRAVELAKAAWQGDLNATMQMGQRSE